MNIIKLILSFAILIMSFNLMSTEIYRITIMGKFSGETINLPNQGKFNMFKGNAAFSDSDGNYGDSKARGIRETDKNNKVTNEVNNKVNILKYNHFCKNHIA